MIFLFNVAGYYIVYLGWRFQARNEMAQRLDDENYSDSETITIKLPYNLPYQDEGGYKRVHGDFQHDGEFYKLVKQKIENDTLYVVCIKDNKEKKIFNFMADIVKASTDMPATSSTMKLLNSLIKDYVTSGSPATIIVSQQGWSAAFVFAQYRFQLSSEYTAYFSPPPDFLS